MVILDLCCTCNSSKTWQSRKTKAHGLCALIILGDTFCLQHFSCILKPLIPGENSPTIAPSTPVRRPAKYTANKDIPATSWHCVATGESRNGGDGNGGGGSGNSGSPTDANLETEPPQVIIRIKRRRSSAAEDDGACLAPPSPLQSFKNSAERTQPPPTFPASFRRSSCDKARGTSLPQPIVPDSRMHAAADRPE